MTKYIKSSIINKINMESQHEIVPQPKRELKLTLKPGLIKLLNAGLNETIGAFTNQNKDNLSPEIDEFRRYLDIIESAVAEPDPDNQAYLIREEYYDEKTNTYYIKLAREDQINKNKFTQRGSPVLNLTSGEPVYESQIAIKSFNTHSSVGMESHKKLERLGYTINLSVSRFLLENGKLTINQLAGIGFKIPIAGDIKACLQTYIGTEGFEQINRTTLAQFNSGKVITYLESLGLSDPRQF